MIVIIYIIVVLTGACSSQQSHTFTTSITQLGLSSDRYFDAAVGARVTGSPSNSLNCEEGNHCITPWWSVIGASNLSESNLTSSNLEQNQDLGSDSTRCDGIHITCNHTCPGVQYSTPIGHPVLYTNKVDCGDEREQSSEYPIHIESALDTDCMDISFLREQYGNTGYNFIINPDLIKMKDSRYSQFLVMEGKLEIVQDFDTAPEESTSSSSQTTFYWTIAQNPDSLNPPYHLVLSTLSSEQHDTTPKVVHRINIHKDDGNMSLFIRQIHQDRASTCFYVNGSRVHCLNGEGNEKHMLAFVNLMETYLPDFTPPFIGRIVNVTKYEINSPKAIISESEILNLAGHTPDTRDCSCQSTSYPTMLRSDWAAHGEISSFYDSRCYQNTSGMQETATLRLNEDNHGIMEAFDGDSDTKWVTLTGERDISITLRFPKKIEIVGIGLSFTVLPEQLNIYSSNESIVGSIQLSDCSEENSTCITWSQLMTNMTESTRRDIPPVISWIFGEEAITDELMLEFTGIQDHAHSFLVTNEIAIISTCHCENGGECSIDLSANTQGVDYNHHCDCPSNVGGDHCEMCSDGYYSHSNPISGLETISTDACESCGCDSLGVCEMVSGQCKDRQERCDSGACYCRQPDGSFRQDPASNEKCVAEHVTLTPSYGPMAGGTLITIRGHYIAGYKELIFSNISDPYSKMVRRQATPSSFKHGIEHEEKMWEELVLVTPEWNLDNASGIEAAMVDVGLVNEGQERPFVLARQRFVYKENPTISSVQFRNVTLDGGLDVTVFGENFDSCSEPKMVLHITCSNHNDDMAPPLESTCDVGTSYTTMTCRTPALTDVLSTISCPSRESRSIQPDTLSNFNIAFGFKFDGYLVYENANQYFNTSSPMMIVPSPNVTLADGSQRVRDGRFYFSGDHLTACCSASDYNVTINGESCGSVTLSHTELSCELPEEWYELSSDSNVTVQVEAGNNTILEAYTTKGDTPSAWQDKKLVKILAIAGGGTLLVLIILVCTQGCVYYKHYFHGHTTTKVMVRDVYRARHSSIRDYPNTYSLPPSSNGGTHTLQPSYYFEGPQVDDEYDTASHHQSQEYYASSDERRPHNTSHVNNNNRGYYLRELSNNSHTNRGYYEIEI